MTIKIGNVFAKPQFEFKKKSAACAEDATCLEVLKDSDSIIFTGKLTANFTEYKATLNDNSIFTFIFGTNALPPVPTEKPQTEAPTTSAIVTEQSDSLAFSEGGSGCVSDCSESKQFLSLPTV